MKLLLLAILAGMLVQLSIAFSTPLIDVILQLRRANRQKYYVQHNSNITLNCDHATGYYVWCTFLEYSGENLGQEESMIKFVPVNCTKQKEITFSPQLQINLKDGNPTVWIYHNCSETHTTIVFDTKLPVFTSPENSTNVEHADFTLPENSTNVEQNVTDRGEEPNVFHKLWFYKYSKMLKYRFVQNLSL